MSQWTHVAGIIRIDTLIGILMPGSVINVIKAQFGNTVSYDDDESAWDKCTVPCGSEGSVQYDAYVTRKENEMPWGYIVIYGDLRDYDNSEAIFKWIEKACDTPQLMIRQCCVTIDIEGQESRIISIDSEGRLVLSENTSRKENANESSQA